jgi:hypothetical protein
MGSSVYKFATESTAKGVTLRGFDDSNVRRKQTHSRQNTATTPQAATLQIPNAADAYDNDSLLVKKVRAFLLDGVQVASLGQRYI